MSTAKRLISGALASWARIGVTMLTQVILIPLYLSFWSVETYGIWIAIQALVSVLSTLDRGYNDYLEYEFLKIGKDNIHKLSQLLMNGLSVTIIVAVVELIVIAAAVFCFDPSFILGESKITGSISGLQIGTAIVVFWVGWSLTNIIGLLFRALCPFGYFPRMGWWNVLLTLVTATLPVFAISRGANLVQASYWANAGIIFVLLLQFWDIYRLFAKQAVKLEKGSLKSGFKSYFISLGLSGRYFLENFRQQGTRLLLAPLLGPVALTAFTTMRTAANVALQGLSTITHPMMPELMRFLKERSIVKVESAFSTVWLVLVLLLAPGVVLLQAIAPDLFHIWTKGKVEFDGFLFAFLSMGVLLYAMAQPAMAIIVGNNKLKIQMALSVFSAIVVLGGILLICPSFGIIGAGVSLFLAELLCAIGFKWAAEKWLRNIGLEWPTRTFKIVVISVITSGIGMILMSQLQSFRWLIFSITCLFLFANGIRYWKSMPSIAVDKANRILSQINILKK